MKNFDPLLIHKKLRIIIPAITRIVKFRRFLISGLTGLLFIYSISLAVPSPSFLSYWKSGLAELSVYEGETERYGELRQARTIMIFVYEEINENTRIKVESPDTPAKLTVPVLKLNHIQRFSTGIYDYSIMTSVFSALAGPQAQRAFIPKKISQTIQDWCGHVYQHILPRESAIEHTLHSYFEKEGDAINVIPIKDGTDIYYEDNFPILLRELDGPILNQGQSINFTLLPSIWHARKNHMPVTLVKASLTKGVEVTTQSPYGKILCVTWTLSKPASTTKYFIETRHPHKLIRWENSQGEWGALTKSRRDTYWQHNDTSSNYRRRELGLSNFN